MAVIVTRGKVDGKPAGSRIDGLTKAQEKRLVDLGVAEYCGDERQRDEAVEMLQSLKPEKNSVTTLFETAGFAIKDAFVSQAVLQLRRAYCEPRKCLYCRLGHKLLSAKIKLNH